MPVPHFNIKITQRSKGNSAVAGAAYQAGEKLFSEYDQKTKNYTCKKEVVYTEIMLPPNAPPEYADRATLWNSVEEIEKQWNSQLARRFVAALPREVPMELLPQMVKEYCEEQFVSKGMCCDFAIHDPDPPGHNPHCHFMLTMRAIDENGKWMPKSRKVYDLDENGERIKLPSGRWKSHKEDTVDWNEQYHAEEWRHGWEIVQNKYLELAGSPERIDMCSYERQGLDIIPTVHMGTAVSALERKGIATNIGNLNRDIAFLNATESTGLQLGLDSYRAPWKIICIRTAFKEYKTYGADLYKEALTMLARGWEGDPDSLRSGILQGMMRFVALYQGEYDPERLVKRLHTVHPMTLVRDEKSLSGTVRYKYMMLILRTYNGASRRRNLPIKP